MRYVTYGIHSRLHYTVKRAGGINKAVRREMFKTKYGFDDETLDLVLMYDVDKLLMDKSIDEIKELILKKKANDKLKADLAMKELNSMFNALCCTSNIMHYSSVYSKLIRGIY